MIRMKITAAGPHGVWSIYQEYGLGEDKERELVDAGAAEYVDVVETAEAAPATENAAARTEKPCAGGDVMRCDGTTNAGERCRRLARYGDYCSVHKEVPA